MNQLAAGEGFLSLEFCHIRIQIVKIVGVLLDKLVGGNHKSKGATGRVVAPLAGLRLHQPGHHINEDARGKVLACAGLFLVGVLFQQPFVQIAQPFFTGRIPIQAVDGRDDLFQVLGLVDVGGRALVDFPHSSGAVFAQMGQQLFIELLQLNAAFCGELVPAVGGRNLAFRAGFLCHLQKQNVSKFGDILVIGDAVIPQHIAEVPELGYDFLCGHVRFPPFSSCNRYFHLL